MPAMVLAVIRAYPKELMDNMSELVAKVQGVLKEKGYDLLRWEAVDIAFGYKAVDLYVIMPEEQERGTEDAEEAIKSVDEIDNVDVVYVTRIST
ncbi:MAG: elongation factor 1-beta [Ignisphaera sp.]|uniref:Elongation factor 1-beta n=1 Tax=Ignisphaera aggregans TaxID=334771 RepID=A0A7J3MXL7_9CREN